MNRAMMKTRRPGRRAAGMLALAAALVLSPLQVAQAAGDPGRTIAVHVENANGIPVTNSDVTLYNSAGEELESSSTDANGMFTFKRLSADTFKVGVQHSGYADWYFDDQTTLDAADPIDLTTATSQGVEATLARGQVISGHLTLPAGVDSGGVEVVAYQASAGDWNAVKWDADVDDGDYAIGGLAAGTFRLCVDGSGNYGDGVAPIPTVCLGASGASVYDIDSAADITVSGAAVTGQDITIAPPSVSGTVTDSSGSPAKDVSVDIADENGNDSVTTTGADGSYLVYAPPGTDTLGAYDGSEYQDYNDGASFHVGPGDHLTGKDIVFSGAGDGQYAIRGRVVGPGGIGMPDVDVYAYDAYDNVEGEATTGGNGRYSLDIWDGAGDYTVKFAPESYGESAGYADQWWQNASDQVDATPVTITDEDTTVTGVDATLPGGTISGTVTDSSSTALGGVTAMEWRYSTDDDEWETAFRTTTASDGSYTLPSPSGKVRVCFGEGTTSVDRHVVARCYGTSSGDVVNAVNISVTDGSAQTGINASLVAAVKVSGTVSDGDGPVAGADVEFYNDSTSDDVSANALGRYAIWLSPGRYTADASADNHSSDSQTITVGDSAEAGVDFQLDADGAITGVVTGAGGAPLPGVEVSIDSDDDSGRTRTNASGAYTIPAAPGDYTVQYSVDGYVTQYYKDAATQGQADPVAVQSGQKKTLDAVSLVEAGSIAGSVVDADASPVAGARVDVYEADRGSREGWSSVGSAATDASGAYTVGDLVPGRQYRVGVEAGAREQFYPGALNVRDANNVGTVAPGATTTVDVTLSAAVHLGGTVTSAGASPSPLSGITVTAYRKHTNRFGKFSWPQVGDVTTAAGGAYDIPVSSGTYRLRFTDDVGTYIKTWYTNGAPSTHHQDAAEVDGTADHSGLDVTMNAGDTISGTIKVGGSPTDSGWAMVYAQNAAGAWRAVSEAETDANGEYTANGLRAGTYRVGLAADGADEVFYAASGSVPSVEAADDITFTDRNQGKSGVDADLTATPAHALTGEVLGPDDAAIEDAYVEVDRHLPDGTWEYYDAVWTGDDGAFSLDVRDGEYRLQANGNSAYEGSYYSVDGSGAEFTPVTVAGTDLALANPIRMRAIATHVVSGSVTGAGGAVVGAHVMLCHSYSDDDYDYDCDAYGDGSSISTTTDAAGHYSLDAPDGAYKLIVESDDASYVRYIAELDVDGADVSRDVTLVKAGSVTGAVAGPSGPVDGGFEVEVYREVTEDGYTFWDYAGDDDVYSGSTYTVTGLAPGTYRACVYASAGMVDQCYGGPAGSTDPWEGGTDIAVTSGNASTVDFTLGATYEVSGTVTDSVTAEGLADIYVTAYAKDGDGNWAYAGDAGTDPDGHYALNLPAGHYVFGFSDRDNDYPDAYLGTPMTTMIDDATVEPITADTPGLDVALVKGAAISGTVSWPDAVRTYRWGTWVSAVDTATGEAVQTDYVSSGDPYYALMGLAAGTYRLDFARASTQRLSGPTMTAPEAQFSGDVNEGDGPGAATTFDLTSGGSPTVVNTDATLHNGLVLSGTVADPNGVPLAGCRVTAYTTDGHLVARASRLSGSDGSYSISGLTNGAYDVRVNAGRYGSDCNQGVRYLTDANGSTGADGATSATVPISRSGTNTQDIAYGDPKLHSATPTISGLTNGVPIVGTTLTAQPGTWTPAGATFTYQWFADGYPIDGATAATFTPSLDQRDAKLVVAVTGSAADHSDTTASSDETAPVDIPTLVNTAAPVISGAAIPGETLTVSTGTWSQTDGVTYDYVWKSDGQAISGVGSTNSYVVAAGDETHAISVTVTAHKAGYYDAVADSDSRTVFHDAVTLTGTPTVTGTGKVGNTLSADASGVIADPSDAALGYQWLRDGSAIPDATDTSYQLTPNDLGGSITVSVVGSKDGYATSAAAVSDPVTVATGDIGHTGTPSITGSPTVGSTLNATTAGLTWTPSSVDLAYQWLRDGSEITGATSPSYTVTGDDAGHGLSVRVTATATGYDPATSTSAEVEVAVPQVKNTAAPTISGRAKVGSRLTASGGTWDPSAVTLAYQWLRNGSAIARATGSSYTPVAADVGRTITVKVTATDASGELGSASVVSAATAKVVRGTIAGAKPKVKGKAKVGKKLTASAGRTSPSGVKVKYQWLRNGKKIKHATHKKYKLTKKDAGKKISVRVTRTKSGYKTLTKTSAKKKVAKVKHKHKKK